SPDRPVVDIVAQDRRLFARFDERLDGRMPAAEGLEHLRLLARRCTAAFGRVPGGVPVDAVPAHRRGAEARPPAPGLERYQARRITIDDGPPHGVAGVGGLGGAVE